MNYFNIAVKNLNRRRGKLFFTIIGILIGITTIVAITAITDAMNVDIGDTFDQIGANIIITAKSDELSLSYGGMAISDITIETMQLDDSIPLRLKNIANYDNISAIAPKLITAAEVEGKNIMIVGVDFAPELMIKSWWQIHTIHDQSSMQRRPLPNAEAKEVILGKSAAILLDKNPGDIVVIQGEEFRVWGVMEPTGSSVDDSIQMDLHTVQDRFQLGNTVSFYEIAALCTSCPIDDMVMQMKAELQDAEVKAVREAVMAREESIDRFALLAKGVGSIVLAIGIVVAVVTMTSSVHERTREIGILRAIGYRKTHIAYIIMIESIIISSIAGILGYFSGLLVARFFGPVVARVEVSVGIDWYAGLEIMLLAVAVGFLASLLPVWKASKLNPSESLRFI